MSFPARKIWTKLSRMTWHEFRTRAEQEFGKRLEYARYRIGMLPGEQVAVQASYANSQFFFSRRELDQRIVLLREHLPEAVEHAIIEANEILQHRFRLLGYRDINYGAEIDWHLDAVHGKRTPLKPWYKIQFLNFDEAGDHKVTWELNRHQHFVTLAKAFNFTQDSRYIREIESEFYSWQKANPYPLGVNWGSSLEVAFRSLSWIWVRNLLVGSQEFSAEFDRDILLSLARNGRYIERYLSTYFSPNTHLIGEALALFFLGTVCPEIPASDRWRQKGFNILLSEIQRQVRPDGVYFEQSLYYHVYALDLFLYARALAGRNQLRLPDSFDASLLRMLQVLDVLCREGPPQGFGDDDGGRLFNPRRNRAEHLSDPLTLGACLFDECGLQSAVLTEESIWLFGERAISALKDSREETLPQSCAFEDGGLYVIASGQPIRSQMLIDAGPHGIGHGGHGHADALSIRLSVDGRPWLIDSGTYVYISPDDARNAFRGTSAHNTLRLDKLDQAVPQTPFSWSSLPDVTCDRWITGDGFTFFSGSHNGYQRLADSIHRRSVLHLNAEYWLVLDVVEGRGRHDLEIFWHFSPGTRVATQENLLTASEAGRQLTLLTADGWNCSVNSGFHSAAYGDRQPAPVAVLKACAQLPAEHATLILPVKAHSGVGSFRRAEFRAGVRSFIYEQLENADHFFFSSGQKWFAAGISSDAELLLIRRCGRDIPTVIACHASFIEIDGQAVFSAPHRVERVEWSAGTTAMASDPEALNFFRGELIRAGTTAR